MISLGQDKLLQSLNLAGGHVCASLGALHDAPGIIVMMTDGTDLLCRLKLPTSIRVVFSEVDVVLALEVLYNNPSGGAELWWVSNKT